MRPRDLVISSDIIDVTQTRLTLLPDKFTYLCTGVQMFCPAIGEEIKRIALSLWPSSGRVYGRDDGLIMAVTVYIPTPFRRATGNRDRVTVAADDVGSLLDTLEQSYATLRGLVRNEHGEVHHHVVGRRSCRTVGRIQQGDAHRCARADQRRRDRREREVACQRDCCRSKVVIVE